MQQFFLMTCLWLMTCFGVTTSWADPALLISKARAIGAAVGETVWPDFGRHPFGILLIDGDTETLYCHPGTAHGFQPSGIDVSTNCETFTRPRQYAVDLLASFPAVDGIPTVVVGTPAATGRAPLDWVLTLLHEHLHQLQYAMPGYQEGVAALDLAGADDSGMWMLNYDFPYQDTEVVKAFQALAAAGLTTLDAIESGDVPQARTRLGQYVDQRQRTRAVVSEADWRYVELQLWQEGVARWLEGAVAGAVSRTHGDDALAFGQLATDKHEAIRKELSKLDPAAQNRLIFYPLGAAEAIMLDAITPNWPQSYWVYPFNLGRLVAAAAGRDG